MMVEGIKYTFMGQSWKYNGQGGWHFVSFPKELAHEIRQNLKWQEEGWGRLKATSNIGNSIWKTAIWYDTKMETYLLPLKAEIRKKEAIDVGKSIVVHVWV